MLEWLGTIWRAYLRGGRIAFGMAMLLCMGSAARKATTVWDLEALVSVIKEVEPLFAGELAGGDSSFLRVGLL
eukprot:13785810-Alexandrium_andersonii.AAC.1